MEYKKIVYAVLMLLGCNLIYGMKNSANLDKNAEKFMELLDDDWSNASNIEEDIYIEGTNFDEEQRLIEEGINPNYKFEGKTPLSRLHELVDDKNIHGQYEKLLKQLKQQIAKKSGNKIEFIENYF